MGVQAHEPQMPQDDVVSARNKELVSVKQLGDRDSRGQSRASVNGEIRAVEGHGVGKDDYSADIEDDGSRSCAIKNSIAQTARASVGKRCDVVCVATLAAVRCVTISFVGDGLAR
jgi:hypothetical protein